MSEFLPNTRFGVDWDDDWFICWDARPGDGLNLIPQPLTVSAVSRSGNPLNVVTMNSVPHQYGLHYYSVTCFDDPLSGAIVGYTAGGQYQLPVEAGKQYVAGLWVRLAEGTPGTTVTGSVDHSGGSFGSNSIALSGDWQRLVVSFAPGLTTNAGFVVGCEAADTTIEVAGLMLVEGNALPTGFNTGTEVSLYENITSYVTQAHWELGKKDRKSSLAAEGIATMTVDNATRLFSPEYANSPLQGKMIKNLRAEVQVQYPTDLSDVDKAGMWVTMWNGWTREYSVDAGRYASSGFASIRCEQGLFRLDNTPMRVKRVENVRFDEILHEIVSAGWVSASSPYIGLLDRSLLGSTFYLGNANEIIDTDRGINVFELVGENWTTGKTKPTAALREVLTIEGGFLYLARDGTLTFRNRCAYNLNDPADFYISLDTDANQGRYSYGADVVNRVEVDVSPKEIEVAELWRSKNLRSVRKGAVQEVEAVFEYEEGSTLSAKSILPFGEGSTITARNINHVVLPPIYYKADVTLENNKAKIRMTNLYNGWVWFTVALFGELVNSSANMTITRQNVASAAKGLKEQKISSKLLTTDSDAINFADFVLLRYSEPIGVFETMEIASRNAEWLERQLDVTLGKVIDLDEYQTGSTRKQVVISESHTWQPGILRSTYGMQALDPVNYWIADETPLGNGTHLGY